MMSPTPIAQIFSMVLIVFTIFTVSLTEDLQLADGFSASGSRIIFDVEPGDTAVHEWMLRNAIDETIGIEVYTVGPGSEFLTFEKLYFLEPGEMIFPEIIISIPKDHPDNIAYLVDLYALKRGPTLDEGVTGISVNAQMKSLIEINIGDNPIYTPPEVAPIAELPEEPIIKSEPVQVEKGEEAAPIIEESLEEKLKRINAANEQVTTEKTVDDEWQESFEEEAVPDYEPEPYSDEPTITDTAIVEKSAEECDFFAWLMSLFGMAKC